MATSKRCVTLLGDITSLSVDAIVNAANQTLRGGGGVDGAIHAAAGPQLVEASSQLAPCPAGEARLTPAFNLDAKYVIHAVGPIFQGGDSGELETLKQVYGSILQIASEQKFESIAIPCISTGAYGFPRRLACDTAIQKVSAWLSVHDFPQKVVFCCFNQSDFDLYETKLVQFGMG